MNRLDYLPLWSNGDIALIKTRWLPGLHPRQSADRTQCAVIEIMLGGTFDKSGRTGRALGDPNTAVLFNPREEFDITHSIERANIGLSIRIVPNAVSRWLPPKCHSSTPFRLAEAEVSPAAHLAARMLVHRLAGDSTCEAMQIENLMLEVIDGSVQGDRAGRCEVVSVTRRRLIERAKQYLNERWDRQVTLRDVAATFECSPWHLSREFTQQTGVRMHQYLVRLRLRAAIDQMTRDGDLTRIALAHGFSSHSHFSAMFKREFGRTPRDVARAMGLRGRDRR